MNAPIIWIVIPGILAVILFFLRGSQKLSVVFSATISGLLGLIALTFKIDTVFSFGFLSVEIAPSLEVLGRIFSITDSERMIVALIYFIHVFWVAGSRVASSNNFFPSISLALSALFIAAISVQPFLYAALVIEISVLLCMLIFYQRGQPVRLGILRFLTFQTLAMPFILFAGWGFESAPSSVDSAQVYLLAGILLILGFSLWLAIFPFHSWLPLLLEDSHAYSAGFVISLLSTSVLLFSMDFFNSFNWLREQNQIYSISLLLGTVMIILGGVFAGFQKRLTRLVGYAMMVEIGFSLLAISISINSGWSSFILLLIPRLFAIAICLLAISIWRKTIEGDYLRDFKGYFYKYPLSVIGFLVGWFTFSGLPLLPGFPTKLPVLIGLSEPSTILVGFITTGLIGLYIAGFRFMRTVFIHQNHDEIAGKENLLQRIYFGVGIIMILVMGIIPSVILKPFLNIVTVFKNLN